MHKNLCFSSKAKKKWFLDRKTFFCKSHRPIFTCNVDRLSGTVVLERATKTGTCGSIPSRVTPTCFFFGWDISVIFLTIVLTLAITGFIRLCFQTFWPKWLAFFFGHLKKISVYDRKKTDTPTTGKTVLAAFPTPCSALMEWVQEKASHAGLPLTCHQCSKVS